MSKKIKIIISVFISISLVVSISVFHDYRVKADSLEASIQEINEAKEALETKITQMTIEYGDDYKISTIFEGIKAQYPNINIEYVVDENNNEIDTKTVGNHVVNVTYSKTDEYNQVSSDSSTLYFEIVDTKTPVIELTRDGTTTIHENEGFDPLSVVGTVYDEVDGELTKSDVLEKGTYTVTSNYQQGKIGNYTVTVEAMDMNGLTSTAQHKVKVIERVYDSNRIYLGSYTAVLYYGDSQAITDAADSANYYEGPAGVTLIADHNYQGFYGGMLNSTGYGFWKTNS